MKTAEELRLLVDESAKNIVDTLMTGVVDYIANQCEEAAKGSSYTWKYLSSSAEDKYMKEYFTHIIDDVVKPFEEQGYYIDVEKVRYKPNSLPHFTVTLDWEDVQNRTVKNHDGLLYNTTLGLTQDGKALYIESEEPEEDEDGDDTTTDDGDTTTDDSGTTTDPTNPTIGGWLCTSSESS